MKPLIFALLVASTGCAVDAGSARESETNLRGLLPENAVVVGVAIAPDGTRYVLDRSGLYRLGESSATRVWSTFRSGDETWATDTGRSVVVKVEPTDVVALDNQRFAVTAENDGFLLDLRDQSFTSYFCYFPSTPATPAPTPSQPISISQTLQAQGIAAKQRTESVAFNPVSHQLFAQPQTFRMDTSTLEGSELFVFGPAGGQPIRVIPLDPSFVAGGMVATSDGRLIVGARNAIYELTTAGRLNLLRELDAAITIAGMTRSPDGELWILDGAGQRLTTVRGLL